MKLNSIKELWGRRVSGSPVVCAEADTISQHTLRQDTLCQDGLRSGGTLLEVARREENKVSLLALRLVIGFGMTTLFPDLFAGDEGSILEAANILHTTLFKEVVPAIQAVGGLTGLGYFIFSPSFKSAGVMVGAIIVPGLIGGMVEPADAALLSL